MLVERRRVLPLGFPTHSIALWGLRWLRVRRGGRSLCASSWAAPGAWGRRSQPALREPGLSEERTASGHLLRQPFAPRVGPWDVRALPVCLVQWLVDVGFSTPTPAGECRQLASSLPTFPSCSCLVLWLPSPLHRRGNQGTGPQSVGTCALCLPAPCWALL